MQQINIFWFRRDLRLEDNIGLYHAMNSGLPVLPVFIFDRNILSQLDQKSDRRVDYFHQALEYLNEELKPFGGGLKTFFDSPLEAFMQLAKNYSIHTVFYNRDYEPYAIQRDLEVTDFLKTAGIKVLSFKDQVIFEPGEILKQDQTPYTVYTPFSKRWKEALQPQHINAVKIKHGTCVKPDTNIHTLRALGFEQTDIIFEVPAINVNTLKEYEDTRNFPAKDATSHLGIALRFGTISIRKCVTAALKHSGVWLNELIWREFFMQILLHYPAVVQHSFKAKYDLIKWRNNEREFDKWCKGETGYLMVDAGMRELNATGFMHNRVRMVVASFLAKHLLIDWRWGEAYFAGLLLDYELASNNGNWQWAAGTGCDAAPYFRIFNPTEQQKKFDPDFKYISKWIGDIDTHLLKYQPIVIHEEARKRALEIYKEALK
ncbi:cryptochrome/photolyase family protein [Gynurincola endophyticus]|uniref:cryptochrome/photolyase family protein n=1 Tax=Gynurincola endophyticus TaxID=2479004 RepID=UPI000F8CA930|nr:deoxyribodipyrimidine photo-lyase [Gynurincola endophyticus]